MFIDKKKINFQIDCGASINIIPGKQAQGHEIKSTTKTLRMWSGSHVKPIGTARINMHNPKTRKKYSVEFVVIQKDLTLLIGARAAQQMELITVNDENFIMTMTMPPPRKNELEQEILAVVKEPTPWVSSLAVPTKKSGALRVCIDPRPLNKALKKETYQIPILDEILPELSQVQVFSTVDLHSRYWHCVLDHKSSLLTTFSTPFGRYRWRRLPFGLSVSSEIFQKRVNQALEDLSGVLTIADNILVYGVGSNVLEATASHNRNLEALLQRCRERGIALNRDKLKFKRKEVLFMGHVLTPHGVKMDQDKAKAQTEEQETAFEEVKKLITKPSTLSYYKPKEELVVQCDASQKGLGAALLQKGKPIAYASRALTDTETRYAQIEKEMLGVVFSLEKFHQYTFGRPVQVRSDHKPLQSIFKKPLSSAPRCLQGMMMRLQEYNIDVHYECSAKMYIADLLSRAYLPEVGREDIKEFELVNMTKLLPVSDQKLREIQRETTADQTQQNHFARYGCPDKVGSDNGPQFSCNEFATFTRTWEFQHCTISPGNSKANGKAESAVKTAKRILRKAFEAGNDPYLAILDYRNTPTQGIGSSLAQRLMGLRTKTLLPRVSQLLQLQSTKSSDNHAKLVEHQQKQKWYYNRTAKDLKPLQKGDTVRMKPLRPVEEVSVPAFSKVMPRNRFLDIWNNIHLYDNTKIPRPGDSNFDKLFKESPNHGKRTLKSFHIDLGKQLIGDFSSLRKRVRPSDEPLLLHNVERHFPEYLPTNESGKRKERRCKLNYCLLAGLNDQSEDYKCAMLLHCIGNEAMRLFNRMKFGEGEDSTKMADILMKYDQHFFGQKQEFFERFQFNRRNQEFGESIDEDISVLCNMAKTCGFCDCRCELLLMDPLLLGISDDKTREELLSTLSKTIKICCAKETASLHVKAFKSEEINQVINKSKKKKPADDKHKPKGKSGDHGKEKHRVKDNSGKGKSGETSDKHATKGKCLFCTQVHLIRKELSPAWGKTSMACGGKNHF
ncbi:Retrovirus-related Pol polyprotein [Stylophora pistillata]|uniref:Retrovirus-related Pol polyprotein n=1 Tax=Stylophora pistillata TaxID=50429 RepID=A0A2B4S5M3_STYPI|nr:Retrovirus-related Pol polyprotein [Stylophora pistillata]